MLIDDARMSVICFINIDNAFGSTRCGSYIVQYLEHRRFVVVGQRRLGWGAHGRALGDVSCVPVDAWFRGDRALFSDAYEW